jgi:hypothetical protein
VEDGSVRLFYPIAVRELALSSARSRYVAEGEEAKAFLERTGIVLGGEV